MSASAGWRPKFTRPPSPVAGSHPLHEAVQYPLLARLVELDDQLVAFHVGDVSVAELEMKHSIADTIGRDRPGGLGHQFTLDCQRHRAAARGPAATAGRARIALAHGVRHQARARRRDLGVVAVFIAWGAERRRGIAVIDVLTLLFELAASAPLRALPAGGAIARPEGLHGVEARAVIAVGRKAAEAALRFGDLDARLRQFVNEARGQ